VVEFGCESIGFLVEIRELSTLEDDGNGDGLEVELAS